MSATANLQNQSSSTSGDEPVTVTTTAAAAAAKESASSSCCSFVVTGFGPFRGVPDNPTSILIRRLQEIADDSSTSKGSSNASNTHAINDTHIFETSAECVREKINYIYGALKPSTDETTIGAKNNGNSSSSTKNKSSSVVMLHLGVNYRGTQFQLEQCAYNDATFRIPDERGYKPHNECILENNSSVVKLPSSNSSKWGKCIETTLDLGSICAELKAKYNEPVCISTDPGRFVCNYTYCLSLDQCQSTNEELICQGGGTREREGVEKNKGEKKDVEGLKHHALFVHVPSFNVVPEERQLEFILRIMETIERQLSGSE